MKWAAVLIGLITFLSTVLRFTLGDSRYPLSIIYYASPLPILFCGSLFCLIIAEIYHHRVRVAFWLVLTGSLGAIWFGQDFRFGVVPSVQVDPEQQVKVLFWNVARKRDLTADVRYMRDRNPDVIALVEVEGDVGWWKEFLSASFPRHDVSALGGNMYLLVKGTSQDSIPHSLGKGSEAREISVSIRGEDYTFLIVDVHANPRIPRKEALTTLATLADQLSDRRLVIVGDFNTPSDSVWLHPLRKAHKSAFAVAGRGYGPTWPTPLPLMELDQIWTNERIIPLSCEHNWTWLSDHLPVLAIIGPAHSNLHAATPQATNPGEDSSREPETPGSPTK